MKTPDFVADIKVGCKTIEDIKKWLACWAVTYTDECSGECETCEYDVGEKESVGMGGKTLAYIQHLESSLAQVERERDAAVRIVHGLCLHCKNEDSKDETCRECMYYPYRFVYGTGDTYVDNWVWRGVCEENTKEE